jgi:protein-ribulosamine 3-kinase
MLEPIFIQLKEIFGNNFQVFSSTPLSGGDINSVYKLTSSEGDFCLKVNLAKKFPAMFEKEALGLNLLRDNSDFTIPKVHSFNEVDSSSYLLLEYIQQSNKSSSFWNDFGNSLANLHRASNEAFGLDHDNYIGSLHQVNTKHKTWSEFYGEQRILEQTKLAFNAKLVDDTFVRNAEQLCSKLDQMIPEEAPSLLHGDLWSGNYMIDSNGNPAIIDPAVYYGHREVDLAMTKLFGGFGDEMYDAYNESFPLEQKWKDRIQLFQLYPVLVHVNLFGGGYVNQASQIIKFYL